MAAEKKEKKERKPREPGPVVSPEDFIKAWQTCATLDEVASKTGLPRHRLTARAQYLRKVGVTGLKEYPRGVVSRIDVNNLSQLAAKLAK